MFILMAATHRKKVGTVAKKRKAEKVAGTNLKQIEEHFTNNLVN